MELVNQIISEVPAYKDFLTVDELNENSMKLSSQYPKVVKIFEVGESSTGERIYGLKIGEGSTKVLLLGCPHPNEPIGAMSIEYLAKRIAENNVKREKLDCTWYMVKCCDVMGTRLNEGWFKGDFTPRKYALNYYRTPMYKQVEWSFPIEYKTLKWANPSPETRALMNLIDNVKPNVIASLHNSSFRATYFYISAPNPKLHKLLHKATLEQNVPIHRGEPETPYVEKLDEAIFKVPTCVQAYDFLAKFAKKDPAHVIKHGAGSYEYAVKANKNVFAIICEVPYIYDERLGNVAEIGIKRKDVVLLSLKMQKKVSLWLKNKLEKITSEAECAKTSPFYEALADTVRYQLESIPAEEKWAQTSPDLDRSASIAESTDSIVVRALFYGSLLRLGLLTRLVQEMLRKNPTKVIKKLAIEVEGKFEAAYKDFVKLSKFEVIPVEKLVKIQLASVLYSILFVKEKI
jgi:hypothetical protein